MSETALDIAQAQSLRTRALIIPREHGAWGLLLVPLFTGVAAGISSTQTVWPLFLFTVAALTFVLGKLWAFSHEPQKN